MICISLTKRGIHSYNIHNEWIIANKLYEIIDAIPVGSEVEIKYTMDYDDALLFKGILVDAKNVIVKEFKEYGR